MMSSKATFSVAALACAWIGLAGCEGGWPLDAKSALEAATASKGAPATTAPAKPAPDGTKPSPEGTVGCDKPSGDPGKDPGKEPPPASDSPQCKVSTDASGALCKVCFDASGKIIHDGCGVTNAGDAEPPLKCEAVTDPATDAVCKTCYGPDGKVASTDCAPVAQPGTSLSCTASKDETGRVCKVCVDESGKVAFTDCGDAIVK
jgi:hypothetical protein